MDPCSSEGVYLAVRNRLGPTNKFTCIHITAENAILQQPQQTLPQKPTDTSLRFVQRRTETNRRISAAVSRKVMLADLKSQRCSLPFTTSENAINYDIHVLRQHCLVSKFRPQRVSQKDMFRINVMPTRLSATKG